MTERFTQQYWWADRNRQVEPHWWTSHQWHPANRSVHFES